MKPCTALATASLSLALSTCGGSHTRRLRTHLGFFDVSESALATLVDPDRGLYALSYRPPASEIVAELARHGVELAHRHDGTRVHALVALTPEGVGAVAPLLHEHPDPGAFPCGRLERIMLQQSEADSLTHQQPVYDPWLRLSQVAEILPTVSGESIREVMTTLTQQPNRIYNTESGTSAPGQVLALWQGADVRRLGSGERVPNDPPFSSQDNVIYRIAGDTFPGDVIILGAHLDSWSREGLSDAPGADDNASGIAVLTTVLRTLSAANWRFSRSIELHAYGAEEVGLQGSGQVARRYQALGVNVIAMLNFDMVAYSATAEDTTLYLVSTQTHPVLRRELGELMHTYLAGDFATASLDAGTSDHQSWTQLGFRAAFPFENPDHFNPMLHTTGDTTENANATALARRFAQLAVTFLAHYAGLSSAAADATRSAAATRADLPPLYLAPASSGLWVSAPAPTAQLHVCATSHDERYRCGLVESNGPAVASLNGRALFHLANTLDPHEIKTLWLGALDSSQKIISYRIVTINPGDAG